MRLVPDWTRRAACLDMDTDLFFPEPTSTQRGELAPSELEAKAVCLSCPVRHECLQHMYDIEAEHGVQDGVWGGTLLWERRKVQGPIPYRIAVLMTMVNEQALFLAERCDLNEAHQLALEIRPMG